MGPRPDSGNRPLADRGSPTVPAWWRDAKLGIFIHWTPASVPVGPRPSTRSARCWRRTAITHWPRSPIPSGTRTRCASPTAPSRAPPRRVATPTAPTPISQPTSGQGLDTWDPQDWARRFRAADADTWCWWPSITTGSACGRPPCQPHPGQLVYRTGRGGRTWRGGARGGPAFRRVLLGRPRLDVQRPPDRFAERPVRLRFPTGAMPLTPTLTFAS